MRIARSIASKANALPSKMLCVLIVLSLLGPAAPALARQPISAAGSTPAAQLGQLTEQPDASHLTQPAAPVTAAARTAAQSWLITWDASTEGSGSYEGWRVTRQSHVTASIVVNYYADGSSEYYANEYTATYLVDVVDTGSCSGGGGYWKHWRHETTDPIHYTGTGPVTPNSVMAYKPTPWYGNRWTINYVNLVLGGIEGYNRYDAILCGGDREHWYETSTGTPFTEHLTSYARAPFNSDDGPLFLYDVDTEFNVTDGAVTYPLHLVEHLRVEPVSGRNLRVRDIEVTQGLQLHNTIPLVQGRRTIVRAYIDIGTEPGPIADVTGRLRVYSGETLLGELEPFNMAGSIYAKRAPDWQQINDTLNWELPWLWTQAPILRFEVEVNHTRQVQEIDYADNTRSVELPLRNCKMLKIGYLPIRFAPPFATPASPDADIARGQEFMRKVYPVADDELLYRPWPGMTWDSDIDSTTFTDTVRSGQRPLQTLLAMLIMNANAGGTAVDRLIGWLPGSASLQLNGIANAIPGQVAWVAQKKIPNYWRGTFAHEVGHTYSLYHNALTTGGYHWIDVYARTIKPPRADGKLLDFISTPGMPEEDRWVSPESYTSLFNQYCPSSANASQASPAQTAEDLLVIPGSVSLTDTQAGELGPFYRITGTSLLPPADSQPRYHLVLKNGTNELASYAFDASQEVESTQPITPTSAPFAFAVPYPAGVNRVELTDRYNHVLSSRVASAHPPTVTVQFPNAAGLTLDGVQTIRWTGSDPDGEALSYAVLYSKDNGVTWNAIGAGITGASYVVDFSSIPGSSSALIKVLASDGFHTASDVSDQRFTVPGKPPVPAIVSPPVGAQFKVGEQIKLQGYAVDLEEGMVASGNLSWSSNLDGALGAGGAREVTLSEGTHTITLNVGGGAASATTTVVVRTGPERFYAYLPLVIR
jgi:hypothetical protein